MSIRKILEGLPPEDGNKQIHRRMLENIYDLIKVTGLKDTQVDDWAELSRKHANEAQRELGNFVGNKNIEWDGDNNTIKIGRDFVIKLVTRER